MEAVDIQHIEAGSYSKDMGIANPCVSREYADGGCLDINVPDSMDAFTEDDGANPQADANENVSDDERTIFLRHPADRAQIEAEIEDLLNAVPRIKDEYRLLDRLGEGIRTLSPTRSLAF
jgi:hypothetical protein